MTAPAPTAASAARAVLGGTALGAGLVALVLAGVRDILKDAPASDQPMLAGPALPLLLWGTFGAICLACLVTWLRSDPRQTPFRRAALAMAAGLGTVLAAMLAAPLHELAGRIGLLVLTALALPAALWLLLRRP
ncbi:MAG: hypothetical protein ACJ8B6_02155 [Gemmatimonadales bacterium]